MTRFIEDEPMPWTNWHAGDGSELARLLRIRSLPTYVLADENGKILTPHRGADPPVRFPDRRGSGPPGENSETPMGLMSSPRACAPLYGDPDTWGGGGRSYETFLLQDGGPSLA